jgi:hypothetical protein
MGVVPALCAQVSKLSSSEEEEEDEESDSATALFALPSMINHACIENCSRWGPRTVCCVAEVDACPNILHVASCAARAV